MPHPMQAARTNVQQPATYELDHTQWLAAILPRATALHLQRQPSIVDRVDFITRRHSPIGYAPARDVGGEILQSMFAAADRLAVDYEAATPHLAGHVLQQVK